MKNFYLIKLVSKWKRAIREKHTNFLLFYSCDLKLVSIDSALNSAPGKLTHSLQKCRRGTKKSNQTWKSSPNRIKSNRVFPGKGKGDKDLILIYLVSPMTDVFLHNWLFCLISALFRGKWMVKVGPKEQTLGSSLFHENSSPSSFSKQCCYLLGYYLWWEFRQYWAISWKERAQILPKRAISWMLNQHAKLKFLTWQSQMLYWWSLPWLCIFMRV